MAPEWSPRCPRCGGPAKAVIRPTPDQMVAGRLRPSALAGYPVGTRVRCSRCGTWFPIAQGTVWEPRSPAPAQSEPLPEEHDDVG